MLSALHTLASERRDQAVAQYRAAGVDLGHVTGGRTNDDFLLKLLIVEHPERSVRQQSINRRRVLRHSDEDDVPVAKHGFGNGRLWKDLCLPARCGDGPDDLSGSNRVAKPGGSIDKLEVEILPRRQRMILPIPLIYRRRGIHGARRLSRSSVSGRDLQVAMAGYRHQDVAVFIEKGTPCLGNQAVGRGFYEPAEPDARQKCQRQAGDDQTQYAQLLRHSLWLRHLSRGNHRRHGTVLVRRLLNDKMRAVATLEKIDTNRRVRQLLGVQLFQFCSQNVSPVSNSRIFGSGVVLRAPKPFYGNPLLGNPFASA